MCKFNLDLVSSKIKRFITLSLTSLCIVPATGIENRLRTFYLVKMQIILYTFI